MFFLSSSLTFIRFIFREKRQRGNKNKKAGKTDSGRKEGKPIYKVKNDKKGSKENHSYLVSSSSLSRNTICDTVTWFDRYMKMKKEKIHLKSFITILGSIFRHLMLFITSYFFLNILFCILLIFLSLIIHKSCVCTCDWTQCHKNLMHFSMT